MISFAAVGEFEDAGNLFSPLVRNHTSAIWICALASAECEMLVVHTVHAVAFLEESFCCSSSCLIFPGRLLFPHQDQLHRPCRSGLYPGSYWLDIDFASQMSLFVLHAASLAQLGASVNFSLAVVAAAHTALGWHALSAFSDFDNILRDRLQTAPDASRLHSSILVCNCHSATHIHRVDDSSSTPICTICATHLVPCLDIPGPPWEHTAAYDLHTVPDPHAAHTLWVARNIMNSFD